MTPEQAARAMQEAAAAAIENRCADYIEEFGMYDPETNVTEFLGNGDEVVDEWDELSKMIRALDPSEVLAVAETDALSKGETGAPDRVWAWSPEDTISRREVSTAISAKIETWEVRSEQATGEAAHIASGRVAGLYSAMRVVTGVSALPPTPTPDAVARLVEAAEMPRAWLDVIGERVRQITVEGWTPEHDDAHVAGELAGAASAYAMSAAAAMQLGRDAPLSQIPPFFMFDSSCWKPTSARRDLVKAAALILAEIERIDRAALAAMEVGNE